MRGFKTVIFLIEDTYVIHMQGIQLSATRVLSLSFEVASRMQTPSLVGNDVQVHTFPLFLKFFFDEDKNFNDKNFSSCLV